MSLVRWLSNKSYKSAKNVSLGGKLPDLIGYSGNEIIAFEEKKYAEELTHAIGQCLHYLNDSNKVFIVLSGKEIERVNPNTLEILRKYGIGLLAKDKSIQTIIDAQFFENSIGKILEKIQSQKQLSKRKNKITNKSTKFHRINQKEILNLFSEYPNGLTIHEIANNLDTSRHIVSKYIFHLKEMGVIEQYELGRAKLCILKKGRRL